MSGPQVHLRKGGNPEHTSIGAWCGYGGSLQPDGTYRRFGGFQFLWTNDYNAATCCTCLRRGANMELPFND